MGKVYMSSQINQSPTITAPAGAELTGVHGLLLKFDTDGNVVAAGAGEKAIGIAIITNNENVEKGEDVDIQIKDIGLVKAGAAFKKGAELAADASGKAIEATAGQFVIGTALRAATADGDLVSIQICPYYKPQ